MRNGTLLFALALVCVVSLLMRRSYSDAVPEASRSIKASGADVLPVCPWRDPQRDLSVLFPGATNCALEARIVSGITVEIVKRLGRQMNAGENPLQIYRVRHSGQMLGSVLVTRVKGEHGGIEVVIGVHPEGAVKRILIQSQREPEDVAEVITSSNFLSSFSNKNAESPLRLSEDLPDVSPANARSSAQAIADGVRSQLIVLSFAEQLAGASAGTPHARRH